MRERKKEGKTTLALCKQILDALFVDCLAKKVQIALEQL